MKIYQLYLSFMYCVLLSIVDPDSKEIFLEFSFNKFNIDKRDINNASSVNKAVAIHVKDTKSSVVLCYSNA